MVFSLLKECVADPTITVDLFAYDIDEPDIVKMLRSWDRVCARFWTMRFASGEGPEVRSMIA